MLGYWTGFDEYPDDITAFPPSAPIRLATSTPSSGIAEFTATGAAYGYGKSFHIKSDDSNSTIGGCAGLLFALGTTAADGHHMVCGFDYQPVDFAGVVGLINAVGDQIMGVSVTAMGYLIINDATHSITQGAKLAQADDPIVAGQRYYIEIEMYCDSAGENAVCSVYADGNLMVAFGGSLTAPSGFGGFVFTDLLLGYAVGTGGNGLYEGGKALYDNFYWLTTGGVEPISRLGITRVGTRGATSETAGQNIGYTRTGGTGVTDSVGKASNDGDTSYYEGTDANDAVLFDSTDGVPGTPTVIYGIMAENYSRRTGAAVRKLKPMVRDAGANYLGSETQAPANYGSINSVWTSRPADGTALTKSNVEALSFGMKISV